MKIVSLMFCTLLIGATISGCETDAGKKQVGGTLLGAVVGGMLGAQIGGGRGRLATTAAGTLLGAFLGREVGKSLDRADTLHAERIARNGLENSRSGHTTRWSNPDSGHLGTFTPVNTYRSKDNLDCRDFEQSVTIDGRSEVATGTACRMPDGTWRIAGRG